MDVDVDVQTILGPAHYDRASDLAGGGGFIGRMILTMVVVVVVVTAS